MIVSLLGVASLSACAHAADLQSLVVERAAFDLQCDASAMSVVDLPGMAYGVRGCGEQATYVITGLSCQHPRQLTKREAAKYCTPVLDHSGTIEPEDTVQPSSSAKSNDARASGESATAADAVEPAAPTDRPEEPAAVDELVDPPDTSSESE